jgi:hypothetical protein
MHERDNLDNRPLRSFDRLMRHHCRLAAREEPADDDGKRRHRQEDEEKVTDWNIP